jgi:DNA-binding transcriptional ArsR family regulator
LKVSLRSGRCNTYDSPVARGDVRLDRPGALRALAHPARLTVVEELYQGIERTASELAELTGLSPSAMSYHLRALERWGVLERAAARPDGRERPWRAAGRSLTLDSDAPRDAAAKDVIVAATLEGLRDELRRWSLAPHGERERWHESTGMSRSILWLTPAEAEAFGAELREVVERHAAGRDAIHHPAGARRVACVVAVVPTVPAAADDTG